MDPALLRRLTEDPARAAILLDVDGTRAPIVERPEDARVPDEIKRELARLVDRYGLVACISGRPGDDAARIVGVEGIRYVGEHGLELDPEAERWAEKLRAFGERAGWPAEEGKRFSLSFHYRTAADQEAARAALEGIAEQALAEGFRPRWGRKV